MAIVKGEFIQNGLEFDQGGVQFQNVQFYNEDVGDYTFRTYCATLL